MKTCTKCNVTQELDNFHNDKAREGGKYPQCKTCRAARRKHDYWKDIEKTKEYQNKPEVKLRRRERDYFNKYGMTLENYEEMLNKQKGCCLLCDGHYTEQKGELLNIDHNHSTGEVRGLLCDICNRALGLFKDSPELLYKASVYLERNGHYG